MPINVNKTMGKSPEIVDQQLIVNATALSGSTLTAAEGQGDHVIEGDLGSFRKEHFLTATQNFYLFIDVNKVVPLLS